MRRCVVSAVFYHVGCLSGKLKIECGAHFVDDGVFLSHFIEHLFRSEHRTDFLSLCQLQLYLYVSVVQSLCQRSAYPPFYLIHLIEQVLIVYSKLDVGMSGDAWCHVAHA